MHTQTIPDNLYKQSLEASRTASYSIPAPDTPEERAMLERVKKLFEDYTYENIALNLTAVYAEEFYFRDAFKQFTKPAELREYMLAGLKPLYQAEFVFNEVARTGDDFYLSWTMRLDFKKTPKNTWEESIGVTHMRFNSEGRIVFHQDYWDPTDIVYRRIPLARQLIALVKRRM
ncbi:MAG: nuclear transport factor 2 family protein [Opitutales bacterium]